MSTIEEDIERFKGDISDLKRKQSDLESKVNAMSIDISLNFDNGKDLQFLIYRHEQYSRKTSIRHRGVLEEMGEDIEKLTFDTLTKELDLDVDRSEIEIVHQIGCRDNSKARSIVVNFLSHKSKELVMRCKKKATNIKLIEDLAHGIKRIFNEVSSNKRFLNVDSVWTIDGKSKFRYLNNPGTFEIRSYADYHDLVNSRQ